MSLELTPKEQEMRTYIEKRVSKASDAFAKGDLGDDLDRWILEAGQKAHELHIALKKRGLEPKHHAYMVDNRGMPADHRNFYLHFHPLEDLLKFLEDPHANDDPVDQTIGDQFTFAVYSRRWGHSDHYRLTRTETGWQVGFKMIGGPCDKGGRPFLFENFRQDNIQHPSDLPGWLEWLWEQAKDQGLSHEQVQAALQQLADWVSTVEKSSPDGGVWTGH